MRVRTGAAARQSRLTELRIPASIPLIPSAHAFQHHYQMLSRARAQDNEILKRRLPSSGWADAAHTGGLHAPAHLPRSPPPGGDYR